VRRRRLLTSSMTAFASLVLACSSARTGSDDAKPAESTATIPPRPTDMAGIDPATATVFTGGSIVSMSEMGRLSALAVSGERIVAIEDGAQALLRGGARRVDLGGRALYPGFIDGHSHWFGDGGEMAAQAMPEWADVKTGVDALRKAASTGWTTVTEHFASEERLQGLRSADERGQVPVHVSGYMPLNYKRDHFGDWYRAYRPDQMLSPRVRVAGAKIFLDNGQWWSREAFDPCFGYPAGDRGRFWWDSDDLRDNIARADAAGYQLSIHCIGDAATDIILNVFSRVDPTGSNARRHNLTHLLALHDEQIPLLRRQGLIANIQLSWMHGGSAERFECLVGRDRLKTLGRWRDLLDAGIPTTASTDFPNGAPDIGPFNGPVMRTLFTAATRIGPNGETPPPWLAAQKISVREALELLTWRGAWALREETIKGRLLPGMLADLVVLTEDPLRVRPEALLGVAAAMTMVGGRVEHVHPAHADLRITR
jgi:hypothetical protein